MARKARRLRMLPGLESNTIDSGISIERKIRYTMFSYSGFL